MEDKQAVLKATATLLENLGYAVLTASTPLEAIKRVARFKKDDIQLLITDVIMPEMNGRDLSEKTMSALPDIKCLYMSGYPADVIAPHGVLDKGLLFLSKPFSMQDLSTKLCEIFDKE